MEKGEQRRGPGPDGPKPSFLDGWQEVAGSVWTRELRRSLKFPVAIDYRLFLPLRRLLHGAQRGDDPEPEQSGTGTAPMVPAERLRLFDLETTGLSGGSGTVAFLAAIGRIDGDGLLVSQFFLADYPGEEEWLRRVLEGLPSSAVAVTYNGRSFDLPLLRTRCVMNGLDAPELGHIDVLACSRRLWRRSLGAASLGAIERGVLAMEREEDLPGAAIPEEWFTYLRRGDSPLMGSVMTHNADDIFALANLVATIHSVYEDPLSWRDSMSIDRCALGRSLIALGRGEEGSLVLEAALQAGDEDAGWLLARWYRRADRKAELRRLWELMPISRATCVARAKFYEHIEGDWREALRWTKRARELTRGREGIESLRRRQIRLERRIAKDGGTNLPRSRFSAGDARA